MLVQLGQRRSTVEVVDLLRECHERIRKFLGQARRLAMAATVPADEVRTAADQIRRYFAESFPMHLADEDEQIAPRIARASADVDHALARMRGDHVDHAPRITQLVELCVAIERDPRQLATLSAELAQVAALLEHELELHLELEERIVFPALEQLPQRERDSIREAMRTRREHALRP
jgi:iron-sulfur cluster repair protein YtfE (RIC family)